MSEPLSISEAELIDFFENGSVGLHLVGADGTILRANRAELEMLGYTRDEYVGRNIREFHSDQNSVEDILSRLTAGEVIKDCETTMICRDGSLRDVLIDSSARWQDGEFTHTRCFTHDATQQKAAERAGQHLAAIIESSDDAIVSKSLDGIVQSWNAGAERIFGYRADEMVGNSIRTLIPPERQHEEDDVLARVRRGERIDHYETVRRRKDGSEVEISLTVSPIKDRSGTIIGASKIARDISDKKRAERLVRQSMEARENFLSLVSHELRTPVTIVLGISELLTRRRLTLSQSQMDQVIADLSANALKLQEVVEHLLVLTRLDSQYHVLHEPIRMERLLEEALQEWIQKLPGRHLRLNYGAELPIAYGDSTLIRLVADNLISNAAKYSDPDKEIEINLSSSDDQSAILLEVLDRGIGLSDAEAESVFQPFYRSPRAVETAGGMGLGLAVCKKVAEVHGEGISAHHRAGGGSRFRFAVPTAPDSGLE